MRRSLVFVAMVVALLCASVVQAQTTANSFTVGQPFNVEFTHAGGPLTDGYRLYMCAGTTTTVPNCATKVGADIPAVALQNGKVVVNVAAVAARGPYVIQASAFNADGEYKSPVLAATGKLGSPGAPGQPSIVVVAQIVNGELKLNWHFVDEDVAEQVQQMASR